MKKLGSEYDLAKLLLIWLVGWAGVMLLNCDKQVPEPVPPKPLSPTPTIGPEPLPEPPAPVEATCDTACENQRQLGCELGNPTPEGSTCEEVCRNAEQSGIPDLRWDVTSLTETTVCTE